MGGSSQGGYFFRPSQSTHRELSDAEINRGLEELLREYNEQEREDINRHLDVLRGSLELMDDDVVRILFGGSQSKHTAVNGLSDVDALAIINDSSLLGEPPAAIIQRMAELIQQRLPQTNVSPGDLAVTVKYSDGIEIQILPAIRTTTGVRIADPDTNQWSNIVHPDRFAQKLTQVNQANNEGVVPTVKLMKGLAKQVISSDRDKIAGYHMESLAIEAFSNYDGPKDRKSMLRHFADYSSKAVLKRIADVTGQSRYVDEYMGPADSPRRQRASKSFQRMLNKFDACKTEAEFKNLFWS